MIKRGIYDSSDEHELDDGYVDDDDDDDDDDKNQISQ